MDKTLYTSENSRYVQQGNQFFYIVLNFQAQNTNEKSMLHPLSPGFCPVSGNKPLCIMARKDQGKGQGPEIINMKRNNRQEFPQIET